MMGGGIPPFSTNFLQTMFWPAVFRHGEGGGVDSPFSSKKKSVEFSANFFRQLFGRPLSVMGEGGGGNPPSQIFSVTGVFEPFPNCHAPAIATVLSCSCSTSKI